jgi:hypothetical protein
MCGILNATGLALVLLAFAPQRAASLPFKALDDETTRFTASALTEPYDVAVERLLDVERADATDLDVLDEHGWFPIDDVPYRTDTYDMFQWATEDVPQDPLTPEEKVAEESGTAGVQVGIPSPVAAAGTILGGIGVLASILADWF